jgi:hypothetical protein
MIESYEEYLLDISSRIESDIYSHEHTMVMVARPDLFGYNEHDMDIMIEKIEIILRVWSKEKVFTRKEFMVELRNSKLNQIL